MFSQTKGYFNVRLGEWRVSTKSNEVALAQTMADQYKIGDTIRLNGSGSPTLLKEHEFDHYRFVNSSEFSRRRLKEVSSAGSGDLNGVCCSAKRAFDSRRYIRLQDFVIRIYANGKQRAVSTPDKVTGLQQALEESCYDNGTVRLDALKMTADDKIQKERKITDAKSQLSDAEKKLADGKGRNRKKRKTLVDGQKRSR